MKANELRLGNIIMFDNLLSPKKELIVNAGFFSALAAGRMRSELKPDEELNFYHKPIELTKEWLLKLSFKQQYLMGSPINYFIKNNLVYSIVERQVELDKPNEFLCKIEFVHELQNLYYAIYKEELEIDEMKK